MFAKAMILPVILTLMFAALLNYFIPFLSCEQAQKQQDDGFEEFVIGRDGE